MRKIALFTILGIMALAVGWGVYAQFTGGSGSGWNMGSSGSAVALNTISADANVKLIRAGQTITNVARAINIATITLSATYPNSNLKVGQKIVVDADDDTFDGVHTITAVADQTHFSYGQAGTDVGSKAATGTAGGHYTSLTAWEAGEGGDLVSATKIPIAECYNDWSGGLVENLVFSGSTTSASYYMKVRVPLSERNNGSTGTGVRIVPSSGDALTISDGYVMIEDLEMVGPTVISADKTLATAGNMLFTGDLTISSGAVLNAGTSNMTITGTFSFSGTINAQGSLITFSGSSANLTSGTFNPDQGTLVFAGTSGFAPKNGVSYNIVKFGSGTCTINGTAAIANKLILDTGASGAVNGGAITMTNGDILCRSGTGGTTAITMNNTSLTQSISGVLSGAGGTLPPLTITKSGKYAYISGTIGMTDVAVTAGTLEFLAGSTYTIGASDSITLSSGAVLKFTGAGYSRLVRLRSSAPGTRWNLVNNSGSTVTPVYTDVQDSNASNAVDADDSPSSTYNINSGNNVNWNFNANKFVWISDASADWSTGAAWSGG
ncbi:MAG: hypothetical protein JXB40_05815, partial [Candidatus Omnitrophica bacterium]|nr:hypothetical protein [Candidatus Omnitrophota bacterium]